MKIEVIKIAESQISTLSQMRGDGEFFCFVIEITVLHCFTCIPQDNSSPFSLTTLLYQVALSLIVRLSVW